MGSHVHGVTRTRRKQAIMIVVMGGGATQQEIDAVRARLEEVGYTIHLSQGQQRTLMGAVGDVAVNKERVMQQLSLMPGVEQVVPILKPYKLAAKEFRSEEHTSELQSLRHLVCRL